MPSLNSNNNMSISNKKNKKVTFNIIDQVIPDKEI